MVPEAGLAYTASLSQAAAGLACPALLVPPAQSAGTVLSVSTAGAVVPEAGLAYTASLSQAA
ncbi:MAG: hypothetical protein ACO29W_19005, partial [Burkholderiaceae bacterium]